MSDIGKTGPGGTWRGVDEEDAVRALFEEAGARPALAPEDLASIREAARAEWRERYGGRGARAKAGRWWMAAAAALLAAVGLLLLRRAPGSPPPAASNVAAVERLTGPVLWSAGDEKPTAFPAAAVGQPLPAATELETGGAAGRPGRLAIRMSGGASVRLDAGTRVRLASATVVELERGGVYVDTGGPASGHENVAVRTAAGLFQSIGTQFEVRAEEGAVTRLKVREGRVRLARGAESVLTDAGQELIVRGDGSLDRGETAADGPEWEWVLTSAPMLDIEGVKVRAFLDWLARERGWRVELADKETTVLADSVVLHGSIAHLTPAEAPDVVLPSSGLGYRLSKGTLVVFVAGKEPVRTPR